MTTLQEVANAARVELEKTKKDLARFEKSMDFLNRAITKAEKDRDNALVDLEWLKHTYDTERMKSICRATKRDTLKEEKILLE